MNVGSSIVIMQVEGGSVRTWCGSFVPYNGNKRMKDENDHFCAEPETKQSFG